MLPESYTRNYQNLSAVTVISPSGQQMPITDLASISASAGPAAIRRTNQIDEVTVQCDVFRAQRRAGAERLWGQA